MPRDGTEGGGKPRIIAERTLSIRFSDGRTEPAMAWLSEPRPAAPDEDAEWMVEVGFSSDSTGHRQKVYGVDGIQVVELGLQCLDHICYLLQQRSDMKLRWPDGTGYDLAEKIAVWEDFQLAVREEWSLNKKDRWGKSLIHRAASLGILGLVKALVTLGADVNTKDDQGKTALDLAAEEKHEPVVALLMTLK